MGIFESFKKPLENSFFEDAQRWKGIRRDHTEADVQKLRGTLKVQHTFAEHGSRKLWNLLNSEDYLPALGAMSGNQAIQQVRAGLKVIYVSGWQVAADANLGDMMYPDQGLYPSNSVPNLIKKINASLKRADEIAYLQGEHDTDWFAPIIADAEAGFGGPLNAYELTRSMIEAGTAAVHFEDQLSSVKKCGQMGGKVLLPTREFVQKIKAARLAADVCEVPTVIVARTDARDSKLITTDADECDEPFILKKERTAEGFFRVRHGLDFAIHRGLAYATYADMVWFETSKPDLDEARKFAEAIREVYPDKMLCYNCSPSFNWRRSIDHATISRFQRALGDMGYKFQFVTLAGFHSLNLSMFKLSRDYRDQGMIAYSKLQQEEFYEAEKSGYQATKHQQFVGAGYFDEIVKTLQGGKSEMEALRGSTEETQF